jgi:hypothetical protein
MMDFGKGPTLIEAFAWLRDETERVARIMDVVERNSVIEGLPPFGEDLRRRIRAMLEAPITESSLAPVESPATAGNIPS